MAKKSSKSTASDEGMAGGEAEVKCLFDLPPLPSLLTQPLGLEGWIPYEPALLATLASEEPLLLIGPHGSAKSFLLERLALALDHEYRFYNASLINYDDLVGIPIPDDERKSLRYISTPSAIWDAEVVFFDEINRTRPELQNKLFPIVHERRVQGVPLEKLRYRWAAMNPPPESLNDDDSVDVYLGAEPLDPALADRFSMVIEVPCWRDLNDDEKRRVLRDQFTGTHDFPVQPGELVASAKSHLEQLRENPPQTLEDYVLALLQQLETSKIALSARRVTMLHRNIVAVQAARIALYEWAYPDLQAQLTDWGTSALIALKFSLPHRAQGKQISQALLLGAHRHAWAISRLDDANPWRQILQIADPLDRCIRAVQLGELVDDASLSTLVLDALSSLEDPCQRKPAALAIYAALHGRRNLHAIVWETMAADLRPILAPVDDEVDNRDDICPRARYRAAKDLCKRLQKDLAKGDDHALFYRYAINLIQNLVLDGYEEWTPAMVKNHFFSLWQAFHGTPDAYPNKEEI